MKNSISVIIPVYNSSNFLNKTIHSVLIQDEVGELILIDDNSTDNSIDIIHNWVLKDKRVKLIKHTANLGSAAARNTGIKNALKPFISFLDSDDYFEENRFKNSMTILNGDASIDGVYTKVKNIFNDNYRKPNYIHRDIIGTPFVIDSKDLFYYIIKEKGDFFSIISLLIRSESLYKINWFDERLRRGQDIDFTYTIAQKLKLVESNDKAIKIFRNLHDNNITSSVIFSNYNSRFKIITKWANKCKKENLPIKIKFAIYIRYAHQLYKNKNYQFPNFIKWSIKFIYLLRIIFKINFDKEESLTFQDSIKLG